ncbi:MAG: hydroxymethylglutaryl-CoA reductase, degradative [Granulosicoccaceae bacterium]
MSEHPTSRLPGFRKLSPSDRLQAVAEYASLDSDQAALLQGGALPLGTADAMVENLIGCFELPLGVATNFVVNGQDRLIPMAVEEPSVVAAASNMARLVRPHGGFQASTSAPVMRAQVQVLHCLDLQAARSQLLDAKAIIIEKANAQDPLLMQLGGGCQDIEVQLFENTPVGPMLVLHLLVDVRDAMGANAVNTMAEAVAPTVERLSGGEVRLRILSNLADKRLASASVRLPVSALDIDNFSGERVAQGMVEACALAIVDPYRAATHNKGIMNGIDPLVLATGNDWRAIEAGAHAYAARNGHYTALTRWERADNGDLLGSIELPMALGLVGGATKSHPAAQAALAVLKVESAAELAQLAAALGLAQNMGALRALATEGIQRGHMALHARNIAAAAGATGGELDALAASLCDGQGVDLGRATSLLQQLRLHSE